MSEVEVEVEVQIEEEVCEASFELVVLNDDINTFDHVIVSLMEVCGVGDTHAIQCTLAIHNLGEAVIVDGKEDELNMMVEGLNMLGLDAIVRKKKKED